MASPLHSGVYVFLVIQFFKMIINGDWVNLIYSFQVKIESKAIMQLVVIAFAALVRDGYQYIFLDFIKSARSYHRGVMFRQWRHHWRAACVEELRILLLTSFR